MGTRDDEATDEATAATVEDLRRVRPGIDPVRRDEARARAERALFRRAEPARAGRFELRDTIAAGGMGVVYRAHDPQLEREVALKVLHPRAGDSPDARRRLIAEARALARLRHPNVVAVHDVLTIEDQVVIVMELVEGQTLGAWDRARPRTWRERVAVYAAAGRGLAAAHALGIVHRDFKPANVVVGDDGRVRVLDFGLARTGDAAAGAREASGDTPAAERSLTATGDVLGTPAFMAPEQIAGTTATAASDQFAFCVALHQALFGVDPFAATDLDERLAAIRAGRIASPVAARGVPGWLRAIVVRGLAPDPAARHPSMTSLLDAVHRGDRVRTRRRRVAVAGALAAGALAAAVIAARAFGRDEDSLATCGTGDAAIEPAWNPTRREAVRAALAAVDTPYARDVTDRVLATLDGYRAAWVEAHRAACEDHRRGARSAALLDRGMLCLDRRAADLAAAAAVLAQVDRTSIARALDVAAGLPRLDACTDREDLAVAHEPPASADARARVAAVRAQLSEAEALERAGRFDAALAAARAALAEADAVAYAPASVEAALVIGRILVFRRDHADAVAVLARAEELAHANRMPAEAVVAAARRLYAAGMKGGSDLAGLQRELATLEPISRGLAGDDFARPLLLNNAGALRLAAADRAGALRWFEAAHAAIAGDPSPDLELMAIESNLAMLTADPAVRVARFREVWQRLRTRLGAAHPQAIAALVLFAQYVPEPAVALPLAAEACALYARFHPELLRRRVKCVAVRAFLAAEAGDDAAAAAGHAEVRALAGASTDPDVRALADEAAGELALARGDARTALPHFAAIVEAHPGDDFGSRNHAAVGHLGAGRAALALGRRRDAVHHLTIAIRHLETATAVNENVSNHQRLARARAALAIAQAR